MDIEVETPFFSVTVPSNLPTYFYADGNVGVAENVTITNGSNKAIKIIDIDVNVKDGWTLVPYDGDIVEQGQFGVCINDVKSGEGTFEWEGFKLDKGGVLDLNYDIKIGQYSDGLDPTSCASLVFTVDYYSDIPYGITCNTAGVKNAYDGLPIFRVSTSSVTGVYTLQGGITTYSLDSPTWSSSDPENVVILAQSTPDKAKFRFLKPGDYTVYYGDAEFKCHVYGVDAAASTTNVNVTDLNLMIPKHYYSETDSKWYTITSIDVGGFDKTAITSVTIPDSVASIGESAFENCDSLTQVNLPESLTSIGLDAFKSCDALESIELPSRLTTLEQGVFNQSLALKEITIPKSVTSIGPKCFMGCTALESVKWYATASIMEGDMFEECAKLKEIYLPKTLSTIKSQAFNAATSLADVYYEGSADDWASINIAMGSNTYNTALVSAIKHYNYSY